MGTEGIWGSHGVQGGRRRDQLSPTEYKGGGGGEIKLTGNQMGIIRIFIGGGGEEESGKFCRDQTKIHQPLPDGK